MVYLQSVFTAAHSFYFKMSKEKNPSSSSPSKSPSGKDVKIKKEPGLEEPDLTALNYYYIHFKNPRGSMPTDYPPINLSGWTYQDVRSGGVVYSISTTFRSNTRLTITQAYQAHLQVKGALPNVRRVLLLQEVIDSKRKKNKNQDKNDPWDDDTVSDETRLALERLTIKEEDDE